MINHSLSRTNSFTAELPPHPLSIPLSSPESNSQSSSGSAFSYRRSSSGFSESNNDDDSQRGRNKDDDDGLKKPFSLNSLGGISCLSLEPSIKHDATFDESDWSIDWLKYL